MTAKTHTDASVLAFRTHRTCTEPGCNSCGRSHDIPPVVLVEAPLFSADTGDAA